MRKFWISTQLRLRKLTRLTKVRIDGVRIDIAPEYTPKFIARAILDKAYEGPERAIVKRVLRPGMAVVEIGAGLGVVGLVAARLARDGSVTSYEANPDLESIIRHNYSLNRIAPTLNMRAVTSDGQPITFYRDDNIVSSSLLNRDTDAVPIVVESVRFRDIVANKKPDVLIMDVEGAEVSLLSETNLEGIHHIIAELHPHIVGKDVIDQLIKTVEGMGFYVEEQIKMTVHFQRSV